MITTKICSHSTFTPKMAMVEVGRNDGKLSLTLPNQMVPIPTTHRTSPMVAAIWSV